VSFSLTPIALVDLVKVWLTDWIRSVKNNIFVRFLPNASWTNEKSANFSVESFVLSAKSFWAFVLFLVLSWLSVNAWAVFWSSLRNFSCSLIASLAASFAALVCALYISTDFSSSFAPVGACIISLLLFSSAIISIDYVYKYLANIIYDLDAFLYSFSFSFWTALCSENIILRSITDIWYKSLYEYPGLESKK